MRETRRQNLKFLWVLPVVALLASCQGEETFTSKFVTNSFVQDYNPAYVDILWVIDDRSPMFNAQARLKDEAKKFFERLDAVTSQYRMGLVTADARIAKGRLQPVGSQLILDKSKGTLSERVTEFGDLIGQLYNLDTDAFGKGLESAKLALKGEFSSSASVPLVLVFISYTDDDSATTSGQSAVDEYKAFFLGLKGGKQDLLRVYSINYMPLPSGIVPESPESLEHRCASPFDNEIDSSPGTYEDRYFKVATALGGQTADLCDAGGFASSVDITGIRLKELPKRFALTQKPNPGTIQVNVQKSTNVLVTGLTWKYDAATNEVVFDDTPPEGTTVVIQYLPNGK